MRAISVSLHSSTTLLIPLFAPPCDGHIIFFMTRHRAQQQALEEIKQSAASHGLAVSYTFTASHDREIVFDNGWVVKVGRGLVRTVRL